MSDYETVNDASSSFIIETNLGGVPITVCSCGVMVVQTMFDIHAGECKVYQQSIAHLSAPPVKKRRLRLRDDNGLRRRRSDG